MINSLGTDYFDNVYAAADDPWNFEGSSYEMDKYEATLASLPHPAYQNGLEIGCSIGVLTRRLSTRCKSLLAIDVSEKAIQAARLRCAGEKNVTFALRSVPTEFPAGRFDLTVLSEVGYYWNKDDLTKSADLIAAHQPQQAHLLLVHWTAIVDDYPLTGDAVHDYWLTRPEWKRVSGFRTEHYRLDLLERLNDGAQPVLATQ